VNLTFEYTIWPKGGSESVSETRTRHFPYTRQGEWSAGLWGSGKRYYVCINATQLIDPTDDRKEQALVSSFKQTKTAGFATGSFEQNLADDMKSIDALFAFEAENCFYPRDDLNEQCFTEGRKWDIGTVVNLNCKCTCAFCEQSKGRMLTRYCCCSMISQRTGQDPRRSEVLYEWPTQGYAR
jgi:hypothetical protein